MDGLNTKPGKAVLFFYADLSYILLKFLLFLLLLGSGHTVLVCMLIFSLQVS